MKKFYRVNCYKMGMNGTLCCSCLNCLYHEDETMSMAPVDWQAFTLSCTWLKIRDLQILRLDTIPKIDAELIQRLPPVNGFSCPFFGDIHHSQVQQFK